MIQQDLNSRSETLGASDMQSVTSIRIEKIDIDVFLKKKLYHIELVLTSCNEKRVACEVVWQIAISVSMLD